MNAILQRNLAALRVRQPEVADAVDAAVVPGGIVEAIGRDGSRTFRVPDGRGGLRWFGGSSMPSVSAVEMFCNAGASGGSVTLPGILTGVEALEIAGRIGPRNAVFVVEESAAELRLAMQLHDYGELIETGRVVFILGDGVERRMRGFFERHPGYELPGHLFRVPQRSAAAIAELQRRIETGGGEALAAQAAIVARATEALRRRAERGGSVSDSPRAAIVCLVDNREATDEVERLSRGMSRMGWSHAVCAVDRPDRRHVAARIATIADAAAEAVVYVGGASPAERALLPVEMPVIHWMVGDGVPGASAIERRGPTDLFVAHSEPSRAKLIEAGVPDRQALRLEPGADGPDHADAGVSTYRGEAAVMFDVPDDRAESAGVTLPSQVALWEAMRRAVLVGADRYDDSSAEDFFERAQRESGTTLDDAGVRGAFLAMLRHRIGPAAVARAVVSSLVRRGESISLWGEGWPMIGRGGDARKGAIPRGAAFIDASAGAVVVLPWRNESTARLAVDAMARGSVAAMRGSAEEFAREYPDLGSLGRWMIFFRNGDELARELESIRRRPERFNAAATEARSEALSAHVMEHRLARLLGRLRATKHDTIPSRDAADRTIAVTEPLSCGRS